MGVRVVAGVVGVACLVAGAFGGWIPVLSGFVAGCMAMTVLFIDDGDV